MVLRFISIVLVSLFATSIFGAACEIRVYARFGDELRDPIHAVSWWDKKYVTLIYDSLIKFDENGDLLPGLAKKWTVDRSYNTLHLSLHKSKKFHDGSPITAKAVAAVLTRLKNEKNPDQAKMKNVKSIRPLEAYELEITYEKLSSYDIYLLATPRFSIYKPGHSDIGSGPWKRNGKKAGRFLFHRADEDTGSCKSLSTIDVPFRDAVKLFERGELDVIEYVSLTPEELAEVTRRLKKRARIEPVRTFDTTVLFFSSSGKNLISKSLDLLKSLYQNQDLIRNSSDRLASDIIPTGISVVFQPPVQKTGSWKRAPEIEIFFPDTTEYKGLLVDNLRELFKKNNSPLKISIVPLEKLYELHSKGDVSFHVETITLQAPHPYGILSMFHSKSSENFTGFSDPEFDRLVSLALSQKDQEALKTFRIASERLISSGYATPLVHQMKHVIVSTKLKGYNFSKISTYHEYYSALRKGDR